MKLEIRGQKEKEEVLELWLEKDGYNIHLKSKISNSLYDRTEFIIRPDGYCYKIDCGNLKINK